VQVEWAVATRFQPDRDLVVVKGALGSILDPSTDHGISAKWGLDATRPVKYEGLSFTKVRIPGEESVDLGRMMVEGLGPFSDYLEAGDASKET
jgi:2,5-furandicarboxylate decarboxylase 1